MDISIRSYLSMGTAAVMGAGTLALAPAITNMPALNTHRVVSDNVDLASFGSLIYIAETALGLDPATNTDPISVIGTNLINFESAVTGVDLAGIITAVVGDLRGLPSTLPGALGSLPGDIAAFVNSIPSFSLPQIVESLPQLAEFLPNIINNWPPLDLTGFPVALSSDLSGLANAILGPLDLGDFDVFVNSLPNILNNWPPLDFTGFGDALAGDLANLPNSWAQLVAALVLPDLPDGILTNGLIGTLGSAFNLLANNSYDISSYDSPAINWGPYAMPFQGALTINDFLGVGGVYPGTAQLGGYSKVGLIPQIFADGLPILSQLGVNAQDYLATTIADLTSGNIFGGLTYAASGVIARAGAVLSVLPSILTNLAGSVVGGVGVVFNKVVQMVTTAVSDLATLNVLGAIGAVRSGLLGPAGIPGALLNLTIGAGVQTGPVDFPKDIPANFVPSTRTVVQQGVKDIAAALATPVPAPAASVTAPEAAAVSAPEASPVASRVSAAVTASAPKVEVAEVETPKVEVAEVETPKVEVAEVETPKVEVPKVEVPEISVPEVEVPKVEVPKVEVPEISVPKVEVPKVEAPAAVTKVSDAVASVKDSVAKKVSDRVASRGARANN